MSIQYSDLESLIFQNANARQYYNKLPKHVREKIDSCSMDITSQEGLHQYAEYLIRNGE